MKMNSLKSALKELDKEGILQMHLRRCVPLEFKGNSKSTNVATTLDQRTKR